MSDTAENIKYRILIPIILAISFLLSISMAGGFWYQKRAIEHSVGQRILGVDRLFQGLLREKVKMMSGQIDYLKSDRALLSSFAAGDRQTLMDKARPLFERMRLKYHITHFYFHRPDKVCFLRVHSPGRYGDPIGRFTLAGAASSGKPFRGIELGPLGTFTLRVVHPWVVDSKLEGYLELGMEIEQITQLVKHSLNLEIFVLIDKQFLNRADWEAGLKILNRKGDWDLLPAFVIINRTMEGSPVLHQKLALHPIENGTIFTVKTGGQDYKGMFNDLYDASYRRVGKIGSLVNITVPQKNLVSLVVFIAALYIAIVGGLVLTFNRYIGSIQTRLTTSRMKIQSEIEARRRSEESLAASEKRFRSLFEESKDAIVNTDLQGNLLMVNPAGMALFGLADQEVASKKLQDFYVDPTLSRKFAAAMHKQGYVRDFGARFYGKDGQTMDCLMTVTAKLAADGSASAYEGIIRDVTPYKKMEEQLRRLATTDFLTGINNRRNFVNLTEIEIDRSRRYKHPFALIMLDIDHFKKINDTYGHSSGDQVLIEFCDVCLKELRKNDFMGRVGGEEFAIALVECDLRTGVVVAERIRNAVASHTTTINNQEVRFTVSLGVVQMPPKGDLNAMLERADNALYQAKENGRNQTRTAE